MGCPTAEDREMCLTCRLGGLKRCPDLGTPLPLVEGEKPKVEHKKADSTWLQWRKSQGHFE